MALNGLKTAIDQVLKPAPTTHDGKYDTEAVPSVHRTGFLPDLISQLKRLPQDAEIVDSTIMGLKKGALIDDKQYQTEKLIQLVSSLPADSENANKLTGTLIGGLWDSMEHPPLRYLGDYKYRTADGSYNNIMYPELGKAGQPYARSVTPQVKLAGAKPDAGVIFDTLLDRKGEFRPHPTKISSLLFNFASIIIHDLFSTNHSDADISNTSSYLDLSPLYGNNQAEQDLVRTKVDGKLKPDTFSTYRVLGFPPGVPALLICFNRFHNYIAEELVIINESSRFEVPILPDISKLTVQDAKIAKAKFDKLVAKRDNDLFQVSRLITCGLYVNIVLIDYVRTILNLNRTDSTWALDPRGMYDTIGDMAQTPTAVGNQVSVEFNLIYRWHCAVSQKDEKWMEDFLAKIFPGKDPKTLSPQELIAGTMAWGHSLPTDPSEWEFAGLKRNASGSFDDAELNKVISESTEDIAGGFGARNIPTVMRVIEVMGIEQSRKWNVASLNEFRKFFKLEPHKKFTDINPDPEIAAGLAKLYDHPDLVEMYPGLLTESAKIPIVPGSGLCPGFTVSRAILSDAVTLVRGDRFYTVDYTAATLTNWGFHEVASDPQVAHGGVIHKLLMRAFPNFYKPNSVYAMYPFVNPQENRKIQAVLGHEDVYDYSVPKLAAPLLPVLTHKAVVQILDDQARFKVPWGIHTYALMKHDYMLSGDKPSNAAQREFVKKQLFCPHNGLDDIRQFYETTTMSMLRERSYKLRDVYQVDAVRDIGNASHAHFTASMFHIPLKSAENPYGLFTEQEMYTILAVTFAYVFLDNDPAVSFALKNGAEAAIKPLSLALDAVVHAVQAAAFLDPIKSILNMHDTGLINDYGTSLIKRLSQGEKSVDEVVWTIIPTAAAMVATMGQGFGQMLDLYLSDKYKHHWAGICEAAQSDSPEDFDKLRKYALEGYRLATPSFGLVRVAAEDSINIQDGPRSLNFNKGDTIFTNFVSACMDPSVFPDPEEIKLDRPEELYIHHGHGPHACLGRPIVTTAMAAQLRVFGRLKNIRRAPGLQGELKHKVVNGAFKVYMNEDWSSWWFFPSTLKVHFDGFEDVL